MSKPTMDACLLAAERVLEPIWCDPTWPRNEFGTPKRVFEMSHSELDRAQLVLRKAV